MSRARKKKSAPGKTSKKTVAKKARPQKRKARKAVGRLRRIVAVVISVLLLAGVAHVFYLNNLIEKRFEGDTWARPSRVYARPLDLYIGQAIDPQQVISELKLADYIAVEQPGVPGLFSYAGNRLTVFSREFHFPDHYQAESKIEIRFKDRQIVEITDLDKQQQIEFFQMTPVVMGSYLPQNGEDRLVVGMDEIPPMLVDILLSVEDRRFYGHFGVSPLSILRALMANIRAGRTVQGGSTITQQLAKNMFLTPERSMIRKANEALMSLLLEARFDKDTILMAYINEVFLLQQKSIAVHGFAQASRLLFHRPLKYLPRQHMALLVGMVKGPSYYNPLIHPERAMKRRNQVLAIMKQTGLVSDTEYQELISKPLDVVKRLPPVNPFPAYLDLVKKQLTRSYSSEDLSARGLQIFTAFDPTLQRQLEKGLNQGMQRFNNDSLQTAVVMADYLTGNLVAMVGDRDTDYPGFNRAILAQRPIGSLIKPLLLYDLLKSGNTLASLVEDRPIRIRQSDGDIWAPQNFDKELHGEMTLFKAFVNSYNLPFVQQGVEQGRLESLAGHLTRLNLLRQKVIYPSILLGATPMTPFEVAQMYQVIANNGYFTPLTTIRDVMDGEHQVLTRIPLQTDELFDRQIMTQVQRALIGVSEQGTARYLKARFEDKTYAGKTGTTNDLRDSWFAGFSNRYLAVVWLGDDDNDTIGLTGSSGALRVWADIVAKLDTESVKLTPDPELEWHYVNAELGGLTEQNCKNSVLLPFDKSLKPDFRSRCEQDYLQQGIQWLQDLF